MHFFFCQRFFLTMYVDTFMRMKINSARPDFIHFYVLRRLIYFFVFFDEFFHPKQKFFQVKWFGEIVVSTFAQALNPVGA